MGVGGGGGGENALSKVTGVVEDRSEAVAAVILSNCFISSACSEKITYSLSVLGGWSLRWINR